MSEYMHVHSYTHTHNPLPHTYIDVHVFKEKKDTKKDPMQGSLNATSQSHKELYILETRGSVRKQQRIHVINLSVSFPFYFHWTDAVMPEHATDRCY